MVLIEKHPLLMVFEKPIIPELSDSGSPPAKPGVYLNEINYWHPENNSVETRS